MGLDLSIRKIGKTKTNKQGQSYWIITDILRLHNTWNFLDKLGDYSTNIANCCKTTFSGEDMYGAANKITNEEEKEIVLKELKEAGVKNSEDIFYEVYPRW